MASQCNNPEAVQDLPKASGWTGSSERSPATPDPVRWCPALQTARGCPHLHGGPDPWGRDRALRAGATHQGARGRLGPKLFPSPAPRPAPAPNSSRSSPTSCLAERRHRGYLLPPPLPTGCRGGTATKGGQELPIQLRNATRPTCRATRERRHGQNNGTDPQHPQLPTQEARARPPPPPPPASVSLWFPPRPGGRTPTPLRTRSRRVLETPKPPRAATPTPPTRAEPPHPQVLPTPPSPPPWPSNPTNTPESRASTRGAPDPHPCRTPQRSHQHEQGGQRGSSTAPQPSSVLALPAPSPRAASPALTSSPRSAPHPKRSSSPEGQRCEPATSMAPGWGHRARG